MKKILLTATVLFLSFQVKAQTPSVLLEERATNGPGWLTEDVVVYADGTVTETHLLAPAGAQSQPAVVTQLNSAEIATIENSIAGIQQSSLVRLDPRQGFNPGGFADTYILTYTDGSTFTFAKNVSGVDFGLTGGSGQGLKQTLDGLMRMAVASH